MTQDQGKVSPVLVALHLEELPAPPHICGAPPKFKVTQETVDYLTQLKDDEKTVVVQGNGDIEIE
jgi:hypothetical protein